MIRLERSAEVGLVVLAGVWAVALVADGSSTWSHASPPPPLAPRAWPSDVAAVPSADALAATHELDAPAPAALLPAWVWHRRPLVIAVVAHVDPAPVPRHRPAIVEPQDSDPGRLDLKVALSPEDELVVVRHEVWRSRTEAETPERPRPREGPWERVAELAPTVTLWTDEHATWPASYTYKVVSLAEIDPDAPAVARYHLTLPPDEARCESYVSARVPKREVWVTATLVHAPAAAGDSPRADLCVRRWDPLTRAFREKRLLAVAEGDPIGRPRSGQDPLFETGAVLLAVDTTPGNEAVTIRWPDRRDEVVRVGAGF